MAIENKPQHGDTLVGEDFPATEGLPALPPFQEFLDELVEQFNDLQQEFAEFRVNSLNFFTTAGYGSIAASEPVGIPNIETAFQTLPADQARIDDPRLVLQNLDIDSIRFLVKGVWAVTVNGTISFLDTNNGRAFQVQLFNVTQDIPLISTNVFVGRNQEGVTFSITLLVQLTDLSIGDNISVRIGEATSAFTSVTLESFEYSTWHVSELQAFPLDETLETVIGVE